MIGTAGGRSWVVGASIAGVAFDELLALEGFPDGSGAAVYVSGSLVNGTGNEWSDIDVFVVGDRAPIGPFAKAASTNETSQHYVVGRRVDFEFWKPDHVRSISERLGSFEPGSGKTINGALFLPIEECFVHRLRIGIPLDNDKAFRQCQERFNFGRFQDYLTERAVRTVDELLEDLCGMIEGDDQDVALFTAREVVGTTAAAYLHMRGNTDPTRKWLPRYLTTMDDGSSRHRELVDACWRLQFPDVRAIRDQEGQWQAYCEECIRLANKVVSWIQR